jgi:lysozyme family protein
MSEEHHAPRAAELKLERYKTRLGFWQAIWGTLITGGIAVAIPATVDAYKAQLELQKSKEDQKLKDKEIQAKILDSHEQYVANFLKTALDQDIELRIRFAEYFSFVSDPSFRPVWEAFRSSLVGRRNDIRDQINSKEKQLDQLRAVRGNLTLQQQMEFSKLERELTWIDAEVGYVRHDSNVTAFPPATSGSTSRDSIKSDSGDLFQHMIVDPNRVADINKIVDRIVAARDHYEPVQTATGIPWFIVGILHQLESGGDFAVHLNGDPLSARTVNVPAGRPANGDPPFLWKDSAIDLLKLSFGPTADFSTIGDIFYEIERYNGLAYRRRNARSPYVWVAQISILWEVCGRRSIRSESGERAMWSGTYLEGHVG